MTAIAAVTVAILAAAGGGLGWARRRLIVVTVVGMSMSPAYRAGDRLLVRRVPVRRLRIGQVVVVRYPDRAGRRSRRTGDARPEWIVKRIRALPGDPMPGDVRAASDEDDSVVPPGRLVVLGDNAESSDDSRQFGPVPSTEVIGAVLRRLSATGRH
ncbi:signal peptidase I [Catenuloplanes nepalensis]|uniref:Signal peptidase I n=1 Tax=Catenuloplanes nepalensis TaxID=587533 RepID=A0ABT9N5I9_9ACTN|nr:S26 family signal peptidase [Catenuloplanes nepalensis]MDP9798691.1 signal peptidase I [Catenuloplanes nepalensis]